MSEPTAVLTAGAPSGRLRRDALRQLTHRPGATASYGRRPAAEKRSCAGVNGLPGHGDRPQFLQPLLLSLRLPRTVN
ncbi:hypothetical protein [Streptomyces sp. NPDC013187]|uniref:hypothetical protein n=1 Tax=Streptomyces sp. NPDC013187 TaxID=3364865 RepID=UPI0036B45B8A